MKSRNNLAPAVGTVYVGSIPTIAPYFLPLVLARFAGRYPGVSVRVIEDITSVLLDHLHHGRVDLVLLALPFAAKNSNSRNSFASPCSPACLNPIASRRAKRSASARSATSPSSC